MGWVFSVRGCLARLAAVVLAGLLAACAPGPVAETPDETEGRVAALGARILALGPGIDPGEARRAAEIAYGETARLRLAYRITDPPLVHNTKVNLGWKPRGLCWHWAEDLEARLKGEGFRTLTLHRAIANADNPFRIDHSTAIIARRGDGLFEGIVLDPWRRGGVLTWVPVLEDPDYDWEPRTDVLERRLRAAHGRPALPAGG